MANCKTVNIQSFVKKQLKLLELERNAEIEESADARKSGNIKELEKRGICVSKLHIASECTGLYGKHLVSFTHYKSAKSKVKERQKADKKEQLTSHCLSNGDIVGLQTSSCDLKEDNIASGIVTKVTENVITVAFEDELDINSSFETFKLVKLCNDVTYQRLKKALENLQNTKKSSHLKDVLFHLTSPGTPLALVKDGSFFPFDQNLNDCQVDAVKFALNQKEVAIIHGPPGTGKTTTVIEIIRQAVKKLNFKVLACAPSNVAVDNLVAKLAASKIRMVRLGHPARVYPHLQKYSLDATLMNSDSAEIIKNVRSDIQNAQAKIKKSKSEGERRKLRGEVKYLKKELFEREDKAIKSVLSSADVILSTTTSASGVGPLKHVDEGHFDLVIVDEAAQALEASCWIPLNLGNRCILAGDHNQLPPTIISHEASKRGLEVTLMERIVKEFGESVVRMLTTQYRMNNCIMSWPSKQLYGNKLTADESVAKHLLSDLPDVVSDENTLVPLTFIDTAGCCMYELKHETEESKGNESEVELVDLHVTALVNAGVKQEAIGIITPYNLQVELLRQKLSSQYPKLEIRSVDGFQGREKEAIIISLVRSNDQGEVGFLKEDRRLNVAITRARRHLAVIGDSHTISHHPFLKSFYDYVTDNGEVRSTQNCLQTEAGEQRQDVVLDILRQFESLSSEKRKNEEAIGGNKNGELVNIIRNETVSHIESKVESRNEKLSLDVKSGDQVAETASKAKEGNKLGSSCQEVAEPKYSKEEIEKMMTDFLTAKSDDVLAFDSSLDCKGRFWVHELAEKHGLAHWSTGEGNDRFISVKKRTKKKSKIKDISSVDSTVNGDCYVCLSCGKEVPTQNKELHLLRCQTNLSTDGKYTGNAKNQSNKDVKKKQTSKDTKTKETTKIRKKDPKKVKEEEDIDDLIAQFTQDDSRCAFDQCKSSVLTLGQKCRHCTRTFCLKHGLAEVHGCGQAAKIDARRTLDKAVMKQKTRPLNDIQKNYVKKKLNKKLDEMENNRTGNKEKKK